MIFASPAEVFTGLRRRGKLGVHARDQGPPADREEGHQRSRVEKDKAERDRRASQRSGRHDRRPRASSTTSCTPSMAFYNLPLDQQAPAPHHRRLLPAARPPRDDRAARPHEGDSASASRPAPACRSPPTTCSTPANKEHDPRRRPRRRSTKVQKQYQRGIITERRALQQGHRRLDARPRRRSPSR